MVENVGAFHLGGVGWVGCFLSILKFLNVAQTGTRCTSNLFLKKSQLKLGYWIWIIIRLIKYETYDLNIKKNFIKCRREFYNADP